MTRPLPAGADDESGSVPGDEVSAGASELRVAGSTIFVRAPRRRRTTITFYVDPELRNRAREAYRSTSYAERDSTWSEMLCKALLAEVERRERLHNSGEEFLGSEHPLAPGRPIGL
jgi:hypothetical protein